MKFLQRLIEICFFETPPFRVGTKVVCVNDHAQFSAKDKLKKGEVYTVRKMVKMGKDFWGVYLEGMMAGETEYGDELAYHFGRFEKDKK